MIWLFAANFRWILNPGAQTKAFGKAGFESDKNTHIRFFNCMGEGESILMQIASLVLYHLVFSREISLNFCHSLSLTNLDSFWVGMDWISGQISGSSQGSNIIYYLQCKRLYFYFLLTKTLLRTCQFIHTLSVNLRLRHHFKKNNFEEFKKN